MIKIIFCLRRLPALSSEDFHAYWREHHAPLVKGAASALRIRRYVQSAYFSRPDIAAAVVARGGELTPFDGVAELWWSSPDDIVAATATPEGRAAGRKLLEDERKFIDLAASCLFYAKERVIFDY